MVPYYFVIIITFIFGLLVRIADEKKCKFLSVFWLILIMGILIIFSGFRDGSFGDTSMYMHSYRLYVQNPPKLFSGRDNGFAMLNLLLIEISTNPQILLIATAFVTNIFNMLVFYKYKSYFELEVFLYIAAGYFTVTMNGIRQCLVAAILFLFNFLIIEGKFILFALIVLLISSVHQSALIMIPVYFILRQEAWSKRMIEFMVMAVIGLIFYKVLPPILFSVLQDSQYTEYFSLSSGGSSFIRTIVNAVPVLLAFLKREELKEKWPNSNIFVNSAIINLIFVSFGMIDWIFNRLTLYFELYNFILVPYIIKNCFRSKEKRLLYLALITCYFIFFYMEHVVGFNMKYNSEYLNFNWLFS